MGLFEFSLPPTSSEGELVEPERSSNLQLTERSCPEPILLTFQVPVNRMSSGILNTYFRMFFFDSSGV
jgi:hypothetical protein